MNAAEIKEWGILIGVVLGNLVAFAGLYFTYRTNRKATAADEKADDAIFQTEALADTLNRIAERQVDEVQIFERRGE